jgi:hypothetical protein
MGRYERLITVDAAATQLPTTSQAETDWEEWQIELLGTSDTELERFQKDESKELAEKHAHAYRRSKSDWKEAVQLTIEQHQERCLHRVLHRRKAMAVAKVTASDFVDCVSSCCFQANVMQ